MTTPAPILKTSRLSLREMTPDDLDFIAEMLADPDVMRHYPKCYTRQESTVWLERHRQRYHYHGFGLWLVSERDSGRPVGQVGLLLQDVDDRFEPEIGYLIHSPYWRRGYAFEAASGVLSYARQVKQFPRVISLIRPDNVPSQGVAIKLGATFEKEAQFRGLPHLVFVHQR
jgi:RimJ/RimL family protein N-acetyltransferase